MTAQGANAQQIEYWNATAGPKWVELQRQLDEQLLPFGAAVLEAARVGPNQSVIDVGCGCGATSLELGRRVGAGGAVLGVDISEVMLARARMLAAEAKLDHVRFEKADAQVHPFARDSADLAYSRFGVMFFEDSIAAFRNLRQALRPGGRIAFICWQTALENPWMSVPMLTVAQYVPVEMPADPHAPGPFAFADAARVRSILESAGFGEVSVSELKRDLVVGGDGDIDSALGFILRMCPASKALAEADEQTRNAAAAAVRASMAPYQSEHGVCMTSAAWIFTARNPEPQA